MSDFIENAPRLIFLKIWEMMGINEKKNFALSYPDLATNAPRVGNHYHCVLCLLCIIYDNFSFDDGSAIPRTFSYTRGPDLEFSAHYSLRTWRLRCFYKPEESKIPTQIFAYFLSKFEQTFSTDSAEKMTEHVEKCHTHPFLIQYPIRILLATNFINNRRIVSSPSSPDQAHFKNFFLQTIKFFADNRITWNPIFLDKESKPLSCYPALRGLAFFLREALNDEENQIGGQTSNY